MAETVRLRRPVRLTSAEEVLEQRPAFLVGAIANKYVNFASALYRRHFGIGFTEWRVIVMLALEPGVAAKRIADVVGLDKAAISRGIKALAAAGLLMPTPETAARRSRAYLLTPAGADLYGRILAISRAQERQLLAGLLPDEVPLLADMLRRMLRQIPAVAAVGPDGMVPTVLPEYDRGEAP